jgi:hypothetical protein
MNINITIDLDRKCAECGKGGAAPSGICLKCITKAMGEKPMKSAEGVAVRARINATLTRKKT